MTKDRQIFDIHCCTYSVNSTANEETVRKHDADRVYYGCRDPKKNVMVYMRSGATKFYYEKDAYLAPKSDKHTSVLFDADGALSYKRITNIKKRSDGDKNYWYGVMGKGLENRLSNLPKAHKLVHEVFPCFLTECGFNPENIDLVCALHLNTASPHIHFLFWEKQPATYEKKRNRLVYRKSGTIPREAVSLMRDRIRGFVVPEEIEALTREREYSRVRALDIDYFNAVNADLFRENMRGILKTLPPYFTQTAMLKDMRTFAPRLNAAFNAMLRIHTRVDLAYRNFVAEHCRVTERFHHVATQGWYNLFRAQDKAESEGIVPLFSRRDLGDIHTLEGLWTNFDKSICQVMLGEICEIGERNKVKSKRKAGSLRNCGAMKIALRLVRESMNNFVLDAESLFMPIIENHTKRLLEIEKELEGITEAQNVKPVTPAQNMKTATPAQNVKSATPSPTSTNTPSATRNERTSQSPGDESQEPGESREPNGPQRQSAPRTNHTTEETKTRSVPEGAPTPILSQAPMPIPTPMPTPDPVPTPPQDFVIHDKTLLTVEVREIVPNEKNPPEIKDFPGRTQRETTTKITLDAITSPVTYANPRLDERKGKSESTFRHDNSSQYTFPHTIPHNENTSGDQRAIEPSPHAAYPTDRRDANGPRNGNEKKPSGKHDDGPCL